MLKTTNISTVGDLIRAWYKNKVQSGIQKPRTKKNYKNSCKRLMPHLENLSIHHLSAQEVEKTRIALLKDAAKSTVHSIIQVLTFAMNWGREIGIDIPEFTVQNPKPKPKEKYIPTDKEVEKILEGMDNPFLHFAVTIAWMTGARISEVYGIKKSDFVQEEGYATVRVDGKTGERNITINPENWNRIQGLMKDMPSDLFGNRGTSNESTKLGKISKAVLGERKCFTFQALRKLRSKTLVMRNMPMSKYQDEMGHSYKTAMKHYAKFREVEVLKYV